MEKISEFDKKILYELDLNSRQSFSKVAKKLKTSPQRILYSTQKLIERGIIKNFVTSFSTLGLGLPLIIKFYFQLKGVDKTKEKEIYSFLLDRPEVNWVTKNLGDYDLFTAIIVKDFDGLAKFKSSFFSKFGTFINEYETSFIQKAWTFPRYHLLGDSKIIRKPLEIHKLYEEKFNSRDKELLKILANNARETALNLADNIGLDVKTVLSKLKHFEKSGIIQGYRLNLDRFKLGIKYYKLFIKLSSYNEKEILSFQNYLLSQKCLIHLIENIGKYEYELEIETKSAEEVQELIKDIRNTYPSIIEKILPVEILEELKLIWLPENF